MTTIAYRTGVLAADTRMIQGTAIIGNVTKIVRRDDDGALAGGAGDCAWVQAFHRWFLDGEKDEMPMIEENSKGVIIPRRGPIVLFEQGGAVEFKPPFLAFGTGKEFALGAMAAGASAAEAVKIGIKFDPSSGGKVMTLTHDEA